MVKRPELIEALLRTGYAIRHKLAEGYTNSDDHSITPAQGYLLRFVANQAPVSVKDIAKSLNTTSSAATQIISVLVNKGYLERDPSPDDRRVILISLTEKAQSLRKHFKEQGLAKMALLFRALTDAELAQYAALNEKLAKSITTE